MYVSMILIVVMHNQAVSDRQTVLVHMNIRHIPITRLLDEKDGGESTMQVYKAGDNEFLELIHVALRLRSDTLAQPCHKGLEISEDAVMACSLYMFIQLVLGGQSLFDFDTDLDDSVEQCNKAKVQNITFSLAQDLVYNATGQCR